MSLLQQLPERVIRNIYSYIEEPYYSFTSYENPLKEFLNVSSSWRKVAQNILCETFSLGDKHGPGFYIWKASAVHDYESLPDCSHLFGMVKNVTVTADEEDILEGKMFVNERQEVLDNLVFPEAASLKFVIDRGCEYDTEYTCSSEELSDADDNLVCKSKVRGSTGVFIKNLKGVVSRLQRMVPNAKDVSIVFGTKVSGFPSMLTSIVDPVFNLYNETTVNSLHLCHRYYHWDIRHPIVNLDVGLYGNDNNASELIVRNATTLRTLRLTTRLKQCFDIWQAIGAEQGIMYPNIQELHLEHSAFHSRCLIQPIKVAEDYVPFPNLKRLFSTNDYMINDDVLFRGNIETLESISLDSELDTFNVITGILAQSKRVSLRSLQLKLGLKSCLKNKDEHLFEHIYASLSRISTSLQILRVNIDFTGIRSLKTVFGGFSQLQVLDLYSYHSENDITLAMVYELAQALPRLQALKTYIVEIGDEFEDYTMESIIKTLENRYGTSSNVLSSVVLRSSDLESIRNYYRQRRLAIFAYVLARMCPQFHRLTLPEDSHTIVFDLQSAVSDTLCYSYETEEFGW